MAAKREPKTLEEARQLLLSALPEGDYTLFCGVDYYDNLGRGYASHTVRYNCGVMRDGDHLVSETAATPAKLAKQAIEALHRALLPRGLAVVAQPQRPAPRANRSTKVPKRLTQDLPLLRHQG